MALSIIGAGFGRTGTESLKKALEILGFGPCYHMFEVLPHEDRVETWCKAGKGELPDWDDVFDGYQATVDWPAAFFWRELSTHYPQAKIILSVRDADAWFASMENTILPILREDGPKSVGGYVVGDGAFGGNVHDRDHIISTYIRNTADIQAAFGPDRLLTYELGSGWAPLCQFLNCPVPDQPYPRGNASDQFHQNIEAHAPPTT